METKITRTGPFEFRKNECLCTFEFSVGNNSPNPRQFKARFPRNIAPDDIKQVADSLIFNELDKYLESRSDFRPSPKEQAEFEEGFKKAIRPKD